MANKLKAALANSVGTPATKPTESARVVQAPPAPEKPVANKPLRSGAQEPSKAGRPDRAGRVLIGGHFESELARRWNILAAERGVTKQELLREALTDLLEKYKAR